MRRFDFQSQTQGHAGEERWRRLPNRARAVARWNPYLHAMPIFAVALIGAQIVQSRPQIISFNNGVTIRSRGILLLKDNSASMTGKESRARDRIRRLELADICYERILITGAGVSTERDRHYDEGKRNLLDALRERSRLLASRRFDAIYVLADFFVHPNGGYVDESNGDGFKQLRELLDSYGLRLYLDTVDDPPKQELIEIAKASGGGLISNN